MPEIAAQYNCDSHVRKIILESLEMMGYAFDKGKFEPWPWVHTKGRHLNHPVSSWVRNSRQNFDWTFRHYEALCAEFYYRTGKIHKCQSYAHWIASNIPYHNLPDIGITEFPRCFGLYKDKIELSEDCVYDYRRYYMLAKRHLAKWSRREIPFWFT